MARFASPTPIQVVHRAYTGQPKGGVIGRPAKPVKSIGRFTSQCYCQTCGQKKRACRCGGDDQ